jgi:ABC-type spermidine/putrescine transport system permease subunit II
MRQHRALSIFVLVLVALVLYAPIVRVAVNAFNKDALGIRWEGFTSHWFRDAWKNDLLRSSVGKSALLAVLSSAGSVIVGTAAVLSMRASRSRQAIVTRVLSLSRIATPEIIIATGLLVTLPLLGVRFGTVAMTIGHIGYLTAYVVLLVGARAARFDARLEEAAADLGAAPMRVLTRIVLPQLAPAIGAAALMAAAFSFDDVAISRSVASPTSQTLPLVLVSMIQRSPTPQIDAVATLLVMAAAGLFSLALFVGRGIDTFRN